MAKVWDYQTKACVQTLEGHGHNVSAVCFHPELPIIITGSEDGSIKFWHSTTYRLESTLNYGLERLWALGCLQRLQPVSCPRHPGLDDSVGSRQSSWNVAACTAQSGSPREESVLLMASSSCGFQELNPLAMAKLSWLADVLRQC